MSEEIKAKELDAKLKAQERVTKPLHPEDIPFLLRESVEVQKADAHDKQEAKREQHRLECCAVSGHPESR